MWRGAKTAVGVEKEEGGIAGISAVFLQWKILLTLHIEERLHSHNSGGHVTQIRAQGKVPKPQNKEGGHEKQAATESSWRGW